jgi:hypothetical protein
MARRFEAFHRPFTLSGGLMRVLGSIVQILPLAVGHRRHQLAVTDAVAGHSAGSIRRANPNCHSEVGTSMGGCYWDVLCQARNSDRLAGVLARRITDAGGDAVAKETDSLDANGQWSNTEPVCGIQSVHSVPVAAVVACSEGR